MISAVVITKNEEKDLAECLQGLSWCEETIVVDDYSEDKTQKIARQLKAKVFLRHLKGDFAAQRNFGLEKAQGKWVLFIDADERVTEELQKEILKALEQNYQGFFLRRKDFFINRWLRFGETSQTRLLRLAQKNRGHWQRPIHEIWQIQGQVGELKNPLLHYPHPTLNEFLTKINVFSSLHAQALLGEGKKASFFRLLFMPLGKFLLNYFWRKGFLDGVAGLVMALMMSLHSFLSWGKLYLNEKNN